MSTQEELRIDLKNLDPSDFYMKHIVKSYNWYFSDYLHIPKEQLADQMDCFKEIVSSHFGVNFHNVQIVGSAKMGYSLSPQKLLNPFHDGSVGIPPSDIDIAIISEYLYSSFWSDLRSVNGLWYKTYYNHLTESIFRGYINDKDLQRIKSVSLKWNERVSPTNVALQDTIGFIHPITYRLYRSWDDLEQYQLIAISKAKKKMEEI